MYSKSNGRIKLDDIKKNHVKKLGDTYLNKFSANLNKAESFFLDAAGESITTNYDNIIGWRNKFAHEGQIPATPTYEEVKWAYILGREVIICLESSLKR